jgi:threonine/homoserine/homoserine lactone efflux protein
VTASPAEAGLLALAGLYATAFVTALSGAVIPGPVLAVTITHAARLGPKAGPLIMFGHFLLEGSLVAALALGLGGVLARPEVSGWVGGAGALIMLWMGTGMLRSLPSLKLDLSPGAAKASGPVRDGFLLSLANPYWSLWWFTVGLSLVAMALETSPAWLGVTVFYAGHISADVAWYFLLSLVVAKGRRFLTDRVHRALVGGCAVFLLGFGAYFGLFAWRQLSGAWG